MRKSSNKRKTLIVIASAMLVAGIGFGAGIMAKEAIASKNADIGIDKAKEIALASVGVSAEKATFTEAVLDDNAYAIGFHTKSNEYDFEVDADTGAIVNRDVSPRDLALPEKEADQSSGSENSAAIISGADNNQPDVSAAPAEKKSDDSVIGVDVAKNAALKHAGLSSASFVEAYLDYDDGIRVYDLEFNSGSRNYEYEIDAHTGAVISCESEAFEYDDDEYDD